MRNFCRHFRVFKGLRIAKNGFEKYFYRGRFEVFWGLDAFDRKFRFYVKCYLRMYSVYAQAFIVANLILVNIADVLVITGHHEGVKRPD